MASRDSLLCGLARSPTDNNGELWLPDLQSGNVVTTSEEPQFPYEFPYEWNSSESSFSSPVESFAGSNETESEGDDDYIAGLAERVAHSMLDDDTTDQKLELGNRTWTFEQKKDLWGADNGKVSMAVSPQSTLPGLGSWSVCNWSSASAASSKGSSRVSSQVSSPPSTPLGVQDDAWEVIYAAAGEVVRLKMLEEVRASTACSPVRGGLQQPPTGHVPGSSQPPHASWRQSYASVIYGMHLPPSGQSKGLQSRSNSFSGCSVPSSEKTALVQAQILQRSLSAKPKEEGRRPLECQHRTPKSGPASNWARQGKPLPQQQSSAVCRSGQKIGCGQRGQWFSDLSSSQWPPIQPAGGSGMRAVFLGSNGSGRESGGTGVFLPRRAGNGPEGKKKPSCSTVLLPTRIVQALNLNVEDMCSPQIAAGSVLRGSTSRKEASYVPSSPTPASMPRVSFQAATREVRTDCERPLYPIHSPSQQVSAELSLPTEWTY